VGQVLESGGRSSGSLTYRTKPQTVAEGDPIVIGAKNTSPPN